MNIDDYTNYNGWEFSARLAFDQMNEYRQVYTELSSDKKVKLAHNFYDHVFRCNDRSAEWKSENALGKLAKHTTEDHPFSARVAHRAIMNDNQYFLDDFNLFAPKFYELIQKITITPKENSNVKIKADNYGDVIVPVYITERYSQIKSFKNKNTKNTVFEFPLPVPEWYGKYERSKVPANLSEFL
tara:strand:+ start:49 stop:603 length:555 start_codon:yes stop_codon:yes gene_type:complete